MDLAGLSNLFAGSAEVQKVYAGNTLLWQRSSGEPPVVSSTTSTWPRGWEIVIQGTNLDGLDRVGLALYPDFAEASYVGELQILTQSAATITGIVGTIPDAAANQSHQVVGYVNGVWAGVLGGNFVTPYKGRARVDVVSPMTTGAGQTITLTGQFFAGMVNPNVLIGGVAQANIVIVSDTTLTFTAVQASGQLVITADKYSNSFTGITVTVTQPQMSITEYRKDGVIKTVFDKGDTVVVYGNFGSAANVDGFTYAVFVNNVQQLVSSNGFNYSTTNGNVASFPFQLTTSDDGPVTVKRTGYADAVGPAITVNTPILQVMHPLSDISIGNWTTAPLWSKVNTENETSFIVASSNTEAYFQAASRLMEGPYTITIQIRARKSASGGNARSVSARYYFGATNAYAQTFALTEVWQTFTLQATWPADNDLYDRDYSQIMVSSLGTTGGSGSVRRDVQVAWIKVTMSKP